MHHHQRVFLSPIYTSRLVIFLSSDGRERQNLVNAFSGLYIVYELFYLSEKNTLVVEGITTFWRRKVVYGMSFVLRREKWLKFEGEG